MYIFIFIVIFILAYNFYNNIPDGFLSFIYSLIISASISLYTLNKNKYSENKHIRLIQKTIKLMIGLFIFIVLLYAIYCLYLQKNIVYGSSSDPSFDNNSSARHCYIIPFLFNKIGKEIPVEAEPTLNLSFNMLILSLIVLFSLIDIMGYFISIYLINKYDVEKMYPRFSKYIRYFEKSRLYFIVIEIIICFSFLIFIILLNASILGLFIFG